MERSLKWRVSLIGFLIVLSTIYLLPNFVPAEALPKWMPGKVLTLGLDLQGGLHLQYSVEVEKALSDKLDRMMKDMLAKLREKKADIQVELTKSDHRSIAVVFQTAEDRALMDDRFLNDYTSMEAAETGPKSLALAIPDDVLKRLQEGAVDKSIETIRSRIDAFGVSEPDIRKGKEGTDIIVQLPGLKESDFARAKNLIGQTAQLEFKLLDDGAASAWANGLRPSFPKGEDGKPLITIDSDSTASFLRADARETLTTFLEGKIDKDHVVGFSQEGVTKQGKKTTESYYRTYYLKAGTELTGEFINDARVAVDQRDNRPFVSLNFDAVGARIFCDLTTANVNKRMAIQLDDLVNSAPVINEPICGGRAQITMGGVFQSSQELFAEAADLVTALEHGALPAPIHKQFETRVGPTLGADSIQKGKTSIVAGGSIVVVFILIYYSLSGLIAVGALVLNVFFILAVLTAFEATLTLPGIAGIILTIGMAVDANVIIFERIREELRLGKPPRSAVDVGFSKAWTAIFDANVTTFIAGVVLYNYGSGPIKGFAVTLMVGIVSSVFTAIVVSRVVFDWWTTRRKLERLSI